MQMNWRVSCLVRACVEGSCHTAHGCYDNP